jgi:glucosamine--fructose-6-phosphate aminotransferase (isomerizing)
MSVSSVYAASPALDSVPFLAISQSGRSPDLLAAVAAAKRAGAWVVALVNDEQSPLAAEADDVLPLHAGPETSVAATKSFIAAASAVAQLVAAWTEDADLAAALDRLPNDLEASWKAEEPPIAQKWRGARSLFVIGRGVGYAAAQEAALKLKETCGLHAEAFSAAEVAHGPMTLVDPGFPILAFVQGDASEAGVLERLDELRARGADVVQLGGLPRAHPMLEPICQVLNFYRAANALALARGRDPDRPPHLSKVTETL